MSKSFQVDQDRKRKQSENTRKFIDTRKGEDFRALAAWLGLAYVAALRRTVGEGERLIS